jgi:hypothetical protein
MLASNGLIRFTKQSVGRSFGALRIVEVGHTTKRGLGLVKARCKCGKSGSFTFMLEGTSKSDTCMCHVFHYNLTPLNEYDKAYLTIMRSYKLRAESRGFTFGYTMHGFKLMTQRNCEYCGLPPSNLKTYCNTTIKYNGIDRVDNTKGYEFRNCVTSCFTCNRAKGGLTHTQFIDHIRLINSRLQSKGV